MAGRRISPKKTKENTPSPRLEKLPAAMAKMGTKLKWCFLMMVLAPPLHCEMTRQNSAAESNAAEWGTTSFEALCRAGMPSSACESVIPDAEAEQPHSAPTHFAGKHGQERARPMRSSGPGVQGHGRPMPDSRVDEQDTPHAKSKSKVKPAVYTIAVPGHRQVDSAHRVPKQNSLLALPGVQHMLADEGLVWRGSRSSTHRH